MTKVEKYESPDVVLVRMRLDSVLCTSFNANYGEDDNLPGSDEEIFEW